MAEGRQSLVRRAAVDVRPLRFAPFRRLLLGQGVAFVGYQVTAVAVPFQMYEITKSSFWVGLLGLAAVVPLVVFGLYGGSVADAMDRRRLYVASSFLLWVSTLALVAQAAAHVAQPGLLLAISAVQSAGFAVSSAVRGAVLPRLVPLGLVPAANTLTFTAGNLGTVLGPLLAGLVLVNGGVAAAYGLDAVLFTAGLYAAVRLPPLPPEGATMRAGWRSIRAGLAFIVTKPVLVMSFAVDLAAMVFAMPRALFPEVAATRFGGTGALSVLFASIAVGSVLGGLVSGWIGAVRRQGLALVLAVLAWGVAVAAAGLVPSLWLAVALLVVAGAMDLVSAVFRQTILQTSAPDELRGRLQGVFIVVVTGGPRLGDLRAGGMAALVGVTASWVGGAVACVCVVVVMSVCVPALVRYRAPSPQELDGAR